MEAAPATAGVIPAARRTIARAEKAAGAATARPSKGAPSYFRVRIRVPARVRLGSEDVPRERFFAWVWASFGGEGGLAGLQEGEVGATDPHDGSDLDASIPSPGKDWVSSQPISESDLYFPTRAAAEGAAALIGGACPEVGVAGVFEEAERDWNAEWRRSFKELDVPPHWRIVPPWSPEASAPPSASPRRIVIHAGSGFGTGTHETTRGCLRALGELLPLAGRRVLDFGAGSGILSIAAALEGAGQVDAIEIDELARDNAAENFALNGTESVRLLTDLARAEGPYDVVLANILREVLIAGARPLSAQVKRPGGTLVLSGLLEGDLLPILETYGKLLPPGSTADVRPDGEWRTVVWTVPDSGHKIRS